MQLQFTLSLAAQRTVDEEVRARWLRSPTGRELVQRAGGIEGVALRPAQSGAEVDQSDRELLGLLLEGLSNREIAERLGIDAVAVGRRLAEMFARIGVSSQADATAFAFREGVV